MIDSAEAYLELISSDDPDARRQAVDAHVERLVWHDLMKRDVDARLALVLNKNLSDEVLLRLARDQAVEIRWHVAMKRRLPDAARNALAADPDDTVRMRVARNKRTPDELLTQLVEDDSQIVREAAMQTLASRA